MISVYTPLAWLISRFMSATASKKNSFEGLPEISAEIPQEYWRGRWGEGVGEGLGEDKGEGGSGSRGVISRREWERG